jgi:hypothetical protein
MQEVLNKITSIIETYEGGAYRNLHEMHRVLTCNMYHLSKIQVEAHQEHNKQYYNSKEKTNAGKEREADKLVPELYLCRKILEAAKGVSIAMSLELKMN